MLAHCAGSRHHLPTRTTLNAALGWGLAVRVEGEVGDWNWAEGGAMVTLAAAPAALVAAAAKVQANFNPR